jgi:hypothetical protein
VTRTGWRVVFLGVTAVAVVLELVAALDGSPDTEPWTVLIVDHVPFEWAAAGFGALMLWLAVHFTVRYVRKRSTEVR